MISKNIRPIFDQIIDVVFSIILLFIILGIAIGSLQLFLSLWELLKFEGITGHYIDIIADVLTLYVLVELSRSLVEYFDSHKLRLTYIVDAAIVFVIREILIMLFKHELKYEMIYALSALLFVLGVIRLGSIFAYQKEKQLMMKDPE